MEKLLESKKFYIGLVIFALVMIVPVVLYTSINGKQKTMVDKETRLSAKYQDNQNVLSTYKKTIKEALGVSQSSTAAQNTVLENVIKGRYENGSSASPSGGSAFSAIVEAYPDVKNIGESFQKVQSAIFAGREAFKNQQTALLDLLRDYDKWRNSGLIHPMIVRIIGAPSDNLEARIGAKVTTGQEALSQMKLLVTDAETSEDFNSGEETPMDLGPSSEPTPKK